jgi:hypothetical protein
MTAVRAKAPALAWLLTALTCLLAGMVIVESRHQAVALPHPPGARAPVGTVATIAVASPPATTPTPTGDPAESLAPPATAPVAEVPVALPDGPAVRRVTRLTLSPGDGLRLVAASGPTLLLVEAGALSVRVDGGVVVGPGPDSSYPDTVLSRGEWFLITANLGPLVRNDGSAPAEALVLAIVPDESEAPIPSAGEPPPVS